MPSVLLVVVDCLRADRLARPREAWPVASRLVADGASFAAAYTTCPTTTPALASLFTGRYPALHGVRALRGSALPDDVPTLPEELARAGWSTWCSVTGPLMQSVGVMRGFADAEYRDVPERSVHGPWGDRIVERVREEAAAERPFFGVVHLWDLHTQRRYPPQFDHRRYGRNAYERALAGLDPWLGRLLDAAGAETLVVLTGDHGENLVLEPRSLAWQKNVHRVTRRLPLEQWAVAVAERGARSESKLLLRLAPRYFWNHNHSLREELVRVPLVFAGPGVTAGPRRTPVSHVDVAPTLLELAGLPEPLGGWQGQSLAPGLASGEEPPARPVAVEVGETPGMPTVPQQAVRDGDWKYVTSLDDERVADALYDLPRDHKERRNLARHRPDVVGRLRAQLESLLSERAQAAEMSAEDDAVLTARLEELGYL